MAADVCLGMDAGWMASGPLDADLGWVWSLRLGHNEATHNDETRGITVSISTGPAIASPANTRARTMLGIIPTVALISCIPSTFHRSLECSAKHFHSPESSD